MQKNKLYQNLIYIFFIMVFNISSYASPITNEDDVSDKQTCYHDLSTKNYDIQPFKKEGFEYYPKYLTDFTKTGIRLIGEDGEFGYYLESLDYNLNYRCCTLDNHTSNVDIINIYKPQFKDIQPQLPLVGIHDDLYMTLKSNPQYKKNWIKTMKLLEPYLLSKKAATKKRKSKKKSSADIYSVSVKSIIRLLEMSHWRLATKLKANNKSKIKQGKYRTEVLMLHPERNFRDNTIYHKKTGNEPSGLNYLEALELRNIDHNELSVLTNFSYQTVAYWSISKSFKPGALDSIMQTFSTEEQKIINKYITITPDAAKIEELVENFAKEFKIKGKLVDKGKLHPITFAAWIHTEIIRITPFVDCNGKLARLWMNAFLLRYGYLAPILTNEEAYLDAVKKELNGESNSFADYIAQQIEFTTKYFPDSNGNPELELSLDKL